MQHSQVAYRHSPGRVQNPPTGSQLLEHTAKLLLKGIMKACLHFKINYFLDARTVVIIWSYTTNSPAATVVFFFFFFFSSAANVDEMKDLWWPSTIQLLSTQI